MQQNSKLKMFMIKILNLKIHKKVKLKITTKNNHRKYICDEVEWNV